ncbi:protein kinase domain-containing protein [Hyalangium sp.]|uniref:protein kinase domain-containing protein n=1 Tax=Hyalangium sp. TaxID=2028555 RepID=UPI00389A95BE
MGRQVGGRYVLERRLAGGGMGAIWQAFDPHLHRRVAIKLTTSQRLSSDGARHQFEKEAKAIAQLHHPNVVQIHDFGLDGDEPYLVMELLEGEDLEARLTRRARLPPAQLAGLFTQIARGLTAAHTVGIVHRDLKPANLFVSRVDGQEVVKILDFGLVRQQSRTSSEVTPESMDGMVGTLRYMSPEQIRGDTNLDHRSDLWSISVVLFRALTGQFPFKLEAVGELLNGSFHPPDTRPSTLLPELGPELDRFFFKALHPDPSQRFQSAQELAASFAAIVQTPRTQAARILVVDDEPDVETLLSQAFRRQIRDKIYAFTFASDGEDALEKLRQNPDIDVILTDINMPRMDGLSFLSRVGEVNPLAKVIIVSAYSDMTNIRTAMNRGAYDFLTKPLDLQDLEATLNKTLKHVAEARQMMHSIEENALLRMFVQSTVLERLRPLAQGPGALAGEKMESTVVLLRLQDFTPVVRQHTPDAVIQRLNEHFQGLVPEFLSRGGMVDRFLGDSVRLMFRGQDHLRHAVDACLAAREQLRAMAARGEEAAARTHGVGLALDSGEVVLGGLGGPELGRLDYTLVGEAVENASRLLGVARRDEILISDRLRMRVVMEFECRSAGERLLSAAGAPVLVHDIVGRRGVNFTRAGGSAASAAREADTPPFNAAVAAGVTR